MRLRTVLATIAVSLLLPIAPAHAAEIETLVSFDVGAGELPEGVAVDHRGNIFVSLTAPVSEIRTDLGTLVSIPVRPDGSAGEASVIVEDPAILGIDGLTVDAHGTIYACVIVQSTVVRIQGDDVVTLADADDGITSASSIAFARGRATTGACTA
jgi:sugar lactone lactonase YvrE